MMQVIQQSFSHSSSSLMMSKMMGTIVDIVNSPLSALEVTISIVLASITRGLCIASISTFILFFFRSKYRKLFSLVYIFLAGFFLGSAGMIAGLYADKFDQMATVTNFVIVPLSFLSGTLYSIERLPEFLKV